MARFYGKVGYINEEETAIDVIQSVPYEKPYKGDLVRNTRRLENGPGVNDNVSLSNTISIISDPYADTHIHAIRYVKWRGTAWKVTNIEVQPPRILLTLGGVYNGETAE